MRPLEMCPKFWLLALGMFHLSLFFHEFLRFVFGEFNTYMMLWRLLIAYIQISVVAMAASRLGLVCEYRCIMLSLAYTLVGVQLLGDFLHLTPILFMTLMNFFILFVFKYFK